MTSILKRISYSLGIAQNASRFQSQLQGELNLQLKMARDAVANSAKATALAVVAGIAGVFAFIIAIIMIYDVLLPHTGSAGALAILAGFFAICSALLFVLSITRFRNIAKFQPLTIPPLYVHTECSKESPIKSGAQGNPSQTRQADATAESELSSFLLNEFRNRFHGSAVDPSLKKFVSSFGGDSGRLAEDVVQALAEQIAVPRNSKKYAILGAALAIGYLMSKNPA